MVKQMGKVNYKVDMLDKKKRHRTFHLNMLRKWHAPFATAYFAVEGCGEQQPEDEVPICSENEDTHGLYITGHQVDANQRCQLQEILGTFKFGGNLG